VLSAAQLARSGRRRAVPSLRQQYQHYILQRIESYKNSLARDEILLLGDEAAQELQSGAAGQFVLTEVLMLETVDRLISRRLRLPSYTKWRKQYQALRQAQRQPIHWGLDAGSALVAILPRLEAEDNVLAVGAGVQAEACLLAALDAVVTFVDEDLGVVDQIEARIGGESLGGQFMAYVASLGEWLPPLDRAVDLAVVDAATLAALPHARRQSLLMELRNRTRAGGVHVILPGGGPAAPEGYLSHYPDWDREMPGPARRGKAGRSPGVVLIRPPGEPQGESVSQEGRAVRL
jgi:hypothetical protein